MANIHKWKIFNKSGSPINMYADAYLDLVIEDTAGGREAEGFFITNSDGKICATEITNGGYLYDDPSTITVKYTNIFDQSGFNKQPIPIDSSIIRVRDVSIFNPNLTNTSRISDIKVDISTLYSYPSVVYNGNIYMQPVSQGLIETEHLFILENTDTSIGYVRPYDASNNNLVLQMIGDEDQIQFFTVDEATQVITWSDIILVEMSNILTTHIPYYDANTNKIFNTDVLPINVNIGFRSDEEGVYKRTLRIYHVVNGNYNTVAEIVVNAQSIGEDERFRTLLTNFGLPDPKDFSKLFKEADINEDLPDYEIVNSKSKHMILEHNNIMPYVGTYKALINSIKWLGYDDVYIREWFKNVKTEKLLSYIVPYEAKDRTQTMLIFSQEQRKEMKKLNQLSLIYCITRETGEIDKNGVPITEDCYSYNLNEVLIKLFALKDWLEKNIIGVNAKIIDITGEGVYFERFKSTIYSTTSYGFVDSYSELMSPYSF
jgi:hypothetical protein